MHDGWWTHLELAKWQTCYQRHPACRPSIDRLILQHRGFTWTVLPGVLSARQQELFAFESRFTQLIVALGVVALNCVEHLLLNDRRLALMPYLGERDCDQLLALHRDWSKSEKVLPAKNLADAALQAGTRWWLRDTGHCEVSDLLTMRLPPLADVPISFPDNAVNWLIKAGRFL